MLAVAALLVAPAASAAPAVSVPTFMSLARNGQAIRGYTPEQIAAAYNLNPLLDQGIDGTGETIGLVEIDTFDPNNIQQFDSAFGLPDADIQEIYPGGRQIRLKDSGEATMDIEWAHAMAPGARIQVYYMKNSQANSAGWKAMAKVINTAVANGVTSLSFSFGACQADSTVKPAEKALASALKSGVSSFVSSGDDGAYAGPVKQCGRQMAVGYPASDPSVVAVGGTSLALDSSDSVVDETSWRLSGGGNGSPILRPTWQVAPTLPSTKYRGVPDVSFVGDPQTGVAIYDGGWQVAGGTSLGAPAWAGIWTLLKQEATQAHFTLGTAPQLLYRIGNSATYSQAFNDVVSGSNGGFEAGPGWDAVTGWGTPNVAGLAATTQQQLKK